jgi:uncharacterized protein YecE (DUF72 family)
MILVGCSGWFYDDWIGRFYPIELAKRKGEWLSYYTQFFNTVAINSTFYRSPGERQVQSWIKKVKDLNDFEYSVKVPQFVTRDALVDGNLERAIFWATSFEKICVKPLANAGLLGSVLLQLSPYFKKEGSALATLKGCWMPFLMERITMQLSSGTVAGWPRTERNWNLISRRL